MLTITPVAGEVIDRPNATLTIRDNDFNIGNPDIILNEFFINSPGNDGKHEFAELTGATSAGMGSLYLAIVDGDVGPGEGSTDLVVDLGAFRNGSSGFTLITALNNFGFRVPAGVTQIGRPELDIEVISNDTATYALLYSPSSSLTTGSFDYDWNNDGILEMPAGVIAVDTIAVKDNGASDRTYFFPSTNTINSNSHLTLYVPDAISRKRGNTNVNSASAWFEGDLIAAGDDPLVYDAANATALPAPGTAMSPGEINTGTTVQSPLVSLTNITRSNPVGTITLTFNGPISQFLLGGGDAGVTITKWGGAVDPRVDTLPMVAGLGTNVLVLSFTGAGVIGGVLPPGGFQLNFTGNSLIGNARAVDTANNGSATGSDFTYRFGRGQGGTLQEDPVTPTVPPVPVPPPPAPVATLNATTFDNHYDPIPSSDSIAPDATMAADLDPVSGRRVSTLKRPTRPGDADVLKENVSLNLGGQ